MAQPALFLDRDGVINIDHGYLHRPEDVVFVEGIFELVAAAKARGYVVVVITNQAGIGRGYYTEADFHRVMQWMEGEFAAHGGRLDGVYFCPDHPEHGLGPYRRVCSCRKPAPGMIVRAAAELGLDLAGSVLIGDKNSDLEAGRAAGVGTLLKFGADGNLPPLAKRIASLQEAIEYLRA